MAGDGLWDSDGGGELKLVQCQRRDQTMDTVALSEKLRISIQSRYFMVIDSDDVTASSELQAPSLNMIRTRR